jgi:hypothetical protein
MSVGFVAVASAIGAVFIAVTTVVSIWVSIITRLVWAKRDRDLRRQHMGW